MLRKFYDSHVVVKKLKINSILTVSEQVSVINLHYRDSLMAII